MGRCGDASQATVRTRLLSAIGCDPWWPFRSEDAVQWKASYVVERPRHAVLRRGVLRRTNHLHCVRSQWEGQVPSYCIGLARDWLMLDTRRRLVKACNRENRDSRRRRVIGLGRYALESSCVAATSWGDHGGTGYVALTQTPRVSWKVDAFMELKPGRDSE